MNINEQLNQGQREYGVNSGGNYFKFEKGDNRIRILTAGEVLATHFFGKGSKPATCYGVEKGCPFHGNNAPKGPDGKEKKPSIKYTCYILNKKEDEVQMADLPYSVIKQVGEYQTNEDYAFTAFPMPYDVTIKFDPDASSPNDMYKVIASPKREEVSDDVKAKVAGMKQSPKEHVEKKKKWQMDQHDKEGIREKVGLTKEAAAEANKISRKHIGVDFAYPENENAGDITFEG